MFVGITVADKSPDAVFGVRHSILHIKQFTYADSDWNEISFPITYTISYYSRLTPTHSPHFINEVFSIITPHVLRALKKESINHYAYHEKLYNTWNEQVHQDIADDGCYSIAYIAHVV